MGNYSSDRCTIDSQTYGQDPDCDQRHSYGALLKTMIKKKYYGSNTPGIFAPVTFKHIYLNGRNDTVSTYKKTNSQSRVAYDAESHGVRFAAKTLVKQEIDRVESTFSAAALIVNGRYDETCIIDQSNNYIKTSIPSFSTAEVVTFNQDPESIPADRRCKLVESSVFNNSVIEKLYQEEIQLLEN